MAETEVLENKETDTLSPTEELYRAEQAKNKDGTVNAELVNWEKENDSIRVEFIVPTKGKKSEVMEWPEPLEKDVESFKLTRLCHYADYELVSLDRLKESNITVPVKKKNNNWVIVLPENKSLIDKIKERMLLLDKKQLLTRLSVTSLLIFFLSPLLALDNTEPGDLFDEEEYQNILMTSVSMYGITLYGILLYVVLLA